MNSTFSFLFKVSRFRFWIYTGGTYVVGYALAANTFIDFIQIEYYIYLLYFFFLANIFIYGVNDLWDEDTDELNPKKDEMEHRLQKSEKLKLKYSIYFILGISLILMLFQSWGERLIFSGFLILSYFYSAPPLRLKKRPILDFSSNYLYVMPGILAYYLVAGDLPSWVILLAAYCHISAMHIFSAIPDIKYDRITGIITTPVYFGKKVALYIVLVFWTILAFIAIYLSALHVLSFLALLFPAFPLILIIRPSVDIRKLYWYLPYINILLGGLLFLL